MTDGIVSWRKMLPKRRDEAIFPPIKSDHAEAIGRLVVTWSLLEGSVRGCAHSLLGVDGESAEAITANMSAVTLSDFVHALLWATREQDWVDKWEDLSTDLAALRTARNDVVHAEWHVVEPSHWALRITSRTIVKHEHGEFSTAKLRDYTERMLDLMAKTDAFRHNVCIPAQATAQSRHKKPALQPGKSRKARALADSRAEKRATRYSDQ